MICSLAKSMPRYSVLGHLDDVHQALLITRPALQHLGRHRQSTPWATEAGGQLFGTINAAQVCVIEASGPYAGDERSRYRYRSNPAAAQRAIDDRHGKGLLYLGEWHTHAEDHPSASDLDDDAMDRLISSSQLNSDSLLMMIVGRARGAAGLAVWCVSGKNMRQWSLSESSESILVSK
ncbi:Mov34/MPN/PAD-1 family protein [Methyloterricola oryzae]|uniref:Mov34/MPN/PAD-1 family protein n=1 Tax=Methyloterricola oryzae TaxID=1495050 RepID=UPI0005EB54BE|nr:Mov34/MPN/PAD-1 family protein [Methyloterricola oryzae]